MRTREHSEKENINSKERIRKLMAIRWGFLELNGDYAKYCDSPAVRKGRSKPIKKRSPLSIFRLALLRSEDPSSNVLTYALFGDVRKGNFDEWFQEFWEAREKGDQLYTFAGDSTFWVSQKPPVDDYIECIKADWEALLIKFRADRGGEPNLEEFKKEFINALQASRSVYSFLRVNHAYNNVEEILGNIDDIIRAKHKAPQIREFENRYPEALRLGEPRNKVHIDILERRLKICRFRIKDGLERREAIKKAIDAGLYRGAYGDDVPFDDDWKEGNKLIKRAVEAGIGAFP